MKYIATVLFAFITIALVVSGILLWKRRKETTDHSRIIWAVLSWFSAFFTLTSIMRTWQNTTAADGAFLEPEHTFATDPWFAPFSVSGTATLTVYMMPYVLYSSNDYLGFY